MGNVASFSASVAGSYSVIITDGTSTQCTGTGSGTLTINQNPTVTVNSPTICASAVSATITATPSPSGTYSYAWTVPQGATNSGNVASFSASVAGSYSVIITDGTSTQCTGTGSGTLTINPNPECSIEGNQTICSGGSSTFTATAGMTSYAWTVPNDFSADTPSINVSVAGIYYVTITNGNGCQSTCSRELMIVPCGGALCTYTQGYYGNLGGMSCAPDEDDLVDGFGSYTTVELIKRALASYNGSMYIGKQGVRHVLITDSDSDIAKLIEVLPGGGPSKVLPNGLFSISDLPPSLLKNGTINNALLAQTITLGLNIGINGALGDFGLQVGTLSTADAEGGCGSDIPKVRECHYDSEGNFDYVVNEYHELDIPENIINALVSGSYSVTVQGLFELANDVLGGDPLPQGVSFSMIESVVDGINNVFDGCKIPIGYNVPDLDCPPTGEPSISSTQTFSVESTADTASFDAYPVPFKDQLTIKYNFDYVSDVKIEVFNSQGALVFSMIDTDSYLNKEVTINISSSLEQEQVYIVKLTTDRGSSTKTVMSSY